MFECFRGLQEDATLESASSGLALIAGAASGLDLRHATRIGARPCRRSSTEVPGRTARATARRSRWLPWPLACHVAGFVHGLPVPRHEVVRRDPPPFSTHGLDLAPKLLHQMSLLHGRLRHGLREDVAVH